MKTDKFKGTRIIRAKSGDWRIVYEFEYPDQPRVFKYIKELDGKEKSVL